MRVLYSGGTECNYRTLQRLVLTADEIAFMDRPSIMFGEWGTVGHDSKFRYTDTSSSPVIFTVHKPPSGEVDKIYQAYIETDLASSEFIQIFLDGLKSNKIFRSRFIQLGAKYRESETGSDVLNALIADKSLSSQKFSDPVNGSRMFEIATPEGRIETLKILLVEASIQVSNALIMSNQIGLAPVTDDPYFCKLMAMRVDASGHKKQDKFLSPYLGLAIADSVIPDQCLDRLTFNDLFEYRRSAIDIYAAWSGEINRLATTMDEIPPDKIENYVRNVVRKEIEPKLIGYKNEMIAARDKLFGDLIKTVVKWEAPSLTIGFFVFSAIGAAIVAFVSAVIPTVPALVDYVNSRRDIKRRNTMVYLIGVTKLKGRRWFT